MVVKFIPREIWYHIFSYDPLHRERTNLINNELLRKSRRRLGDFSEISPNSIVSYEYTLHENIHADYKNISMWKSRGWCSVDCGALNIPHACDFCLFCDADEFWCTCKKVD